MNVCVNSILGEQMAEGRATFGCPALCRTHRASSSVAWAQRGLVMPFRPSPPFTGGASPEEDLWPPSLRQV